MPRGFAPLRRGGTAAQQQPPSREIGRRPPGDCLDPSPRPAAVTTNAHRPLKLPLDRDSIARYIIGCRVAAYELTYGQPSLKGEIDIDQSRCWSRYLQQRLLLSVGVAAPGDHISPGV